MADPAARTREPLPEPIASAEPGLYRVHWAEGGSSLAAVGMNSDGSRWIAPTNWLSPATQCGPNPWWHAVTRLELVAGTTEREPDDVRARALTLAAAQAATEGAAEMARFTREGPTWPTAFEGEPIEMLADATKMAIEASIAAGDELDDDRGQLLGALHRYLDGWFG